MPHPFSASFHDQSATLRQLKLLVMVLVLSNIGLGIFSFYLLRKTDRSYTELISHTVPILGDLQELTARSVQTMRLTNPALFPTGQPEAGALEAARAEIRAEQDRRTGLLAADWVGMAK